MSKARNIADLLDANGDVALSNLDNVPPSNDASALTTGTLPAARLPGSGVDASSLTTGTLPIDRIANAAITGSKLSAVQNWSVTSSTGASATWRRYAIGNDLFLWRLYMDSIHAGSYINMPSGSGLNAWIADYIVYAEAHRFRRHTWHASEKFNGFTGFNYVANGSTVEMDRFNHSLGNTDAKFHAIMITRGQ